MRAVVVKCLMVFFKPLWTVKERTTFAFPTLRLIVCILDTHMAVSKGGGYLNGFAWNAPITLVLAAWWS